jgi:hypothetical protein
MPDKEHLNQIMIAARLLAISAFVLALTSFAQSPTTEWSSDFNLRLAYPSDLVKADPAQAMQDGHLTLLGISGTSDPALAEATRCLRPDLLLQLPQTTAPQAPTATVLLAELDLDCLTPEQQVNSRNLLASMAELVAKVPGMQSIVQPTWYNIGWQKVHMAASQGAPKASPSAPASPQTFTMGLSTVWNNHLLVWYFSSNSIEALNRITKTTVRFGRSSAAPLYPLTIGNGSPASP